MMEGSHHHPPQPPRSLSEASLTLELLPLLVPRLAGSVTTRIQVTIERAIALGLFPEGRLPAERQLATALDVSRTALRSALDRVRESGYIEQSLVGRSGGAPTGMAVRLTVDEVIANATKALTEIDLLMATRRFIEPAFARHAATSASPTCVDRLIESQERLVRGPTQLTHRTTDGEFHYELAITTGSSELVGVMLRARADVMRWRDLLPMEDTVGHSVTEHWAVIRAIQDRDPAAAEAAMRAHVDSSAILFGLFLRRYIEEPEIILAEGQAAVARPAGPPIEGHPILDDFMTNHLRRSHR